MEKAGEDEQDLYEQSFIEVPAILDKHKAAAAICEGKCKWQSCNESFASAWKIIIAFIEENTLNVMKCFILQNKKTLF